MSSAIFASASDLGKSFVKLTNAMFFRHRGCLVERTGNGYIVFGKQVNTMAGVDAIIDSAYNSLKNSIK